MTTFTLGEIATKFDLRLTGDSGRRIRAVATLTDAQSDTISFLANAKYAVDLQHTNAGAVIIHPDRASDYVGNKLICADPYTSFAKVSALFQAPEAAATGIHTSAVVDATARIGHDVSIHANAVIGAECEIGDKVRIGAGVVVGDRCHISHGCKLFANVTLVQDVHLGDSVIIHSGAVLGADGFGLADDQGRWIKVPQTGGVRIGAHCEIGANTTIDRGTMGDTILEEDVRLDNQIQIAHNVRIGAHTAIAGCTAVAGSTTIGKNCLIAGGAGLVGHITLCDGANVSARTLVTHDIREPGWYSSGSPMEEQGKWRRNAARMRQLDSMARKIQRLEKAWRQLNGKSE